jgi:hypothetical protein
MKIELPYNLGDTVYGIIDGTIAKLKVCEITIYRLKDNSDNIEIACSVDGKDSHWISEKEDIGKYVFLTMEEAQQALEKMESEVKNETD